MSLGRFDLTGKVGVRLVRFDLPEPPRTTVMKGEAGLKGNLEGVREGLTAPNILEPLCCRGKQAYREGLSEFVAVRPHGTTSNHIAKPTGSFHMSSGRFGHFEPHRTTGRLWEPSPRDRFT